MSRAEPLVQVSELYKHFGSDERRVEVLRGVNLSIKRGQSVAVVGASGVGKSTLLHILGTLERPSSGTVQYEGEDVFSLPEEALAMFRNQTIGFVFQFHHLLAEFTALENTMMPALIARKGKRESREMAEEVLAQVGLSHRLAHRVGELSGGEQQRVAVARALVLRPKVLLADEPTGNLDTRTGGDIHELLLRLNREHNVSMVVVTHNMELAGMMEFRLQLKDGTLRQVSEDVKGASAS
ncbi:MAG: ABC transporter ATP-binding protein [Deltaproteobacteria bacterium]|nr:ABC transporter ATP-binding protein [Deltaproteobacteria bacterium]MBW2069980.1 ABC transporter ATP-binding protein [Deltaproteobacteria bacterium]